ncbi:MAG: chemotaxis protein CheW, partial [Candidatus Sumerlaeota bacterium]
MTETEQKQQEAGNGLAELAGKYLTFKLGHEEYGIEILKVMEIIKLMEITNVPRTPDYVRGVINLRGKVIPVVDLRCKFGM